MIPFGQAGAESPFDFECLLAGGRAENQVYFRAGHRPIEGTLNSGVVNAADELLDDETLPCGADDRMAAKVIGGFYTEQCMQQAAVAQDDFLPDCPYQLKVRLSIDKDGW